MSGALLLAIIQSAGWPIWFLLIALVVALTIIVERLLYLRRNRILPPALLNEAIRVARAGRVDAAMVQQLEDNSPLGRVLAAGMRNLRAPREVMKEAIEEAGRATAHDLERYLTALGTVATLAPLLGLFGTVVGMIELFGAQDAGAGFLSLFPGPGRRLCDRHGTTSDPLCRYGAWWA